MQTMEVVVFASQKGGSGKTTLSGHMAVAALRADAGPVAIVDTDPQGSLLAWAKARGQTFITAVRSHDSRAVGKLLAANPEVVKSQDRAGSISKRLRASRSCNVRKNSSVPT